MSGYYLGCEVSMTGISILLHVCTVTSIMGPCSGLIFIAGKKSKTNHNQKVLSPINQIFLKFLNLVSRAASWTLTRKPEENTILPPPKVYWNNTWLFKPTRKFNTLINQQLIKQHLWINIRFRYFAFSNFHLKFQVGKIS